MVTARAGRLSGHHLRDRVGDTQQRLRYGLGEHKPCGGMPDLVLAHTQPWIKHFTNQGHDVPPLAGTT